MQGKMLLLCRLIRVIRRSFLIKDDGALRGIECYKNAVKKMKKIELFTLEMYM